MGMENARGFPNCVRLDYLEEERRCEPLFPGCRIVCAVLAQCLMKTPLSWKEAAGPIHQETDNTVIVTLREQGASCIKRNGESFLAPGYPVDAADTIGGGCPHRRSPGGPFQGLDAGTVHGLQKPGSGSGCGKGGSRPAGGTNKEDKCIF